MGGGEKYRNVYLREISTLSRSCWVSQFQTAMGSKKWSVAKCIQCSWEQNRSRSVSGYLGPVISRVPCGKRERVSRRFGIVILHK